MTMTLPTPTTTPPREQQAFASFAGTDTLSDEQVDALLARFAAEKEAQRALDVVLFALGNGVYTTIEQAQQAILPAYTRFMALLYPHRDEDDHDEQGILPNTSPLESPQP